MCCSVLLCEGKIKMAYSIGISLRFLGFLFFFRIYLDLLDLCFGFLGVFFLDFFLSFGFFFGGGIYGIYGIIWDFSVFGILFGFHGFFLDISRIFLDFRDSFMDYFPRSFWIFFLFFEFLKISRGICSL